MKKVIFNSCQFICVSLLISLFGCSSESSKEVEEDVNTITFHKSPGSCDCEGWMKVGSDPTSFNCEDECYLLVAANDSVKLNLDELEGVCIDFTGSFFIEKQPVGEEGIMLKTFVYSAFKIISGIAKTEKVVENINAVIPMEKIDTSNFFKSFVAYVQNGNIYDMLGFYDSTYVLRHCVSALENDTAACMNEQYCGDVIKGIESNEVTGCVDFFEIEKIEFLRKSTEGNDRVAYFKISSFDGRVLEIRWKYILSEKNNKPVFAFIGI